MACTADDLVRVARSWLGVPFAHQGRSRSGVDCAGFVICVCRQVGSVPAAFDLNGYRRWPEGGELMRACDEHMIGSSLDVAHIAVMRFSEAPQHLGFLAPYRHGGLSLVHAIRRGVVEHRIDRLWRSRMLAFYRIPGVEGVAR